MPFDTNFYGPGPRVPRSERGRRKPFRNKHQQARLVRRRATARARRRNRNR